MIKIDWPKKIPFANKIVWLQFLSNITRLAIIGEQRYGTPRVDKRYMTRLYKEYRAYKVGGNRMHLLNIAVYCFLECWWPENHLSHYDELAGSVTRGRWDDKV